MRSLCMSPPHSASQSRCCLTPSRCASRATDRRAVTSGTAQHPAGYNSYSCSVDNLKSFVVLWLGLPARPRTRGGAIVLLWPCDGYLWCYFACFSVHAFCQHVCLFAGPMCVDDTKTAPGLPGVGCPPACTQDTQPRRAVGSIEEELVRAGSIRVGAFCGALKQQHIHTVVQSRRVCEVAVCATTLHCASIHPRQHATHTACCVLSCDKCCGICVCMLCV